MPARSLGSRSRRLRDPRDLEGIITSQIVYWRAFFILFHHFRRLKRFNLLNNSRTISQPCAAVRGRARPCAAVRRPVAGSQYPWACQSSQPACQPRACAVRGRPNRPRPEIDDSRRKIPKQVKKKWNCSGKRPNMAGEEEDMGSLLMDIADGDLFNLFSEEWAMEMEMGLENEAESVGRDGRQDGFLTEPPEFTDPIETMMGAYGIGPLSPQGPTPSRYGFTPSRHGYPPSRHGSPSSRQQRGFPPLRAQWPSNTAGGYQCTPFCLNGQARRPPTATDCMAASQVGIW